VKPVPHLAGVEVVAAVTGSCEGRLLAESIIGLADPREIVANLDTFCEARLGSGLSGIFLCELSVGAAFGLQLGSGARTFLKVHPPERPAEYLRAVHEVQGHLYRRAFPCPRPVAGPAPFGRGLATVDEFVDRGEYADAHEPEIRRAMARTLARLVELAGEFSGVRALSLGWNWPQTGLWPTPQDRKSVV
jgi:Ser/Thr protein kinase RdoA (MazF antagonist)